ncbi:hypothetical protein MXB_1504, partial [Myxobolus squamalis]
MVNDEPMISTPIEYAIRVDLLIGRIDSALTLNQLASIILHLEQFLLGFLSHENNVSPLISTYVCHHGLYQKFCTSKCPKINLGDNQICPSDEYLQFKCMTINIPKIYVFVIFSNQISSCFEVNQFEISSCSRHKANNYFGSTLYFELVQFRILFPSNDPGFDWIEIFNFTIAASSGTYGTNTMSNELNTLQEIFWNDNNAAKKKNSFVFSNYHILSPTSHSSKKCFCCASARIAFNVSDLKFCNSQTLKEDLSHITHKRLLEIDSHAISKLKHMYDFRFEKLHINNNKRIVFEFLNKQTAYNKSEKHDHVNNIKKFKQKISTDSLNPVYHNVIVNFEKSQIHLQKSGDHLLKSIQEKNQSDINISHVPKVTEEWKIESCVSAINVTSHNIDCHRTTLHNNTRVRVYSFTNQELLPYLSLSLIDINLCFSSKKNYCQAPLKTEYFIFDSRLNDPTAKPSKAEIGSQNQDKLDIKEMCSLYDSENKEELCFNVDIKRVKIDVGVNLKNEDFQTCLILTCNHMIEHFYVLFKLTKSLIDNYCEFHSSLIENYEIILTGFVLKLQPLFGEVLLDIFKRNHFSDHSKKMISNFSFLLLYLIENSCSINESLSLFMKKKNKISLIFNNIFAIIFNLKKYRISSVCGLFESEFLKSWVFVKNKISFTSDYNTKSDTDINSIWLFKSLIEALGLDEQYFPFGKKFDLKLSILKFDVSLIFKNQSSCCLDSVFEDI